MKSFYLLLFFLLLRDKKLSSGVLEDLLLPASGTMHRTKMTHLEQDRRCLSFDLIPYHRWQCLQTLGEPLGPLFETSHEFHSPRFSLTYLNRAFCTK